MRFPVVGSLAALVAGTLCLASGLPATAGPRVSATGRNTAPNALVRAMSLDEELGLLSGWPVARSLSPGTDRPIGVGWLPGVPRLGIPGLTFSDGPAGVRIRAATTALPAPIALAATFDPALARDYGAVLGREARARDQDVVFAPMLNTVRVPTAGRNFETLGEDPLLLGSLAAAEIEGIQAQGTIATAKHLAENNQEQDRMTVDVRIDERTLNEGELRGFEAAVRQARPGAVMCSYNKVNGTYACENPSLLTGILRNRWGFEGFVPSDYTATHSAGKAVRAGLDVEFLGVNFLGLKADLLTGRVGRSDIDAAVGHILSTMGRFGLLDHASPTGGTVVDRAVPAFDAAPGERTAREVAEQGSVLLRNDGVLPLERTDSVAVIGPTGRQLLGGGGGSSHVAGVPGRSVGALQALIEDGVSPAFAVGRDLEGTPVPASALTPPAPFRGPGLLRVGLPPKVDPMVDFTAATAFRAGSIPSWTGTLTVPEAGTYRLAVQVKGALGSLSVDGKQVGETGVNDLPELATQVRVTTGGLANPVVDLPLTRGAHRIAISTLQFPGVAPVIAPTSGQVSVRLAWVTPAQRRADLAAAVEAARKARTAVVFAYVEGTEGTDQPSLTLPDGQDELISAVASANPRTVVVVNSGYPVLMPWLSNVAAVLDIWYPGQEGGRATADLLLGRASPGGRLPVTFPRSEADSPVGGRPERYPGVNDREEYSEGVFVGYRWYDEQGVEPLFPFGFGLTYTTFAFSDLVVQDDRASVTVRNTGSRAGDEVVQVYAGRLAAPVPTPPRQLAGVTRVHLAPGESRHVSVDLDAKSFSYWDVRTHGWVRPAGAVTVSAGSSSRDLPLRTTLTR